MHSVRLVNPEVHQDGCLWVKDRPVNFNLHAGKMLEHGARWCSGRTGIKHHGRAGCVMLRFIDEGNTVFYGRLLCPLEVLKFVHGMIGMSR